MCHLQIHRMGSRSVESGVFAEEKFTGQVKKPLVEAVVRSYHHPRFFPPDTGPVCRLSDKVFASAIHETRIRRPSLRSY
jgi:hypothetical protein